jgi:hypothetical protein
LILGIVGGLRMVKMKTLAKRSTLPKDGPANSGELVPICQAELSCTQRAQRTILIALPPGLKETVAWDLPPLVFFHEAKPPSSHMINSLQPIIFDFEFTKIFITFVQYSASGLLPHLPCVSAEMIRL